MLNRAVRTAALIAALSLVPGFANAKTDPASNGAKWKQTGQASWYGPNFHGRRTTSGDVFNQRAMTAAHSTLPMGTKVRVTTKKTGKSVVVTINDRLPPKKRRVIDLSRGAAKKLGIVQQGVATVTLVPARPADAEEVAQAPDTDK